MAESAPSLAELPAPRRIAIAGLFREAWRRARELAELYAGFARHTPIAPLKVALDELARLETAHAAALGALAPVLDPDGDASRPPLEATSRPAPLDRGSLFARAFDAERTVDSAFREIGALLGDPALCPGLAPLVAEAARHRARLRELYLRYS